MAPDARVSLAVSNPHQGQTVEDWSLLSFQQTHEDLFLILLFEHDS